MKKEQILKKAIEKAVKNGWIGSHINYEDFEYWVELFKEAILFDHSFAKAFWPSEKVLRCKCEKGKSINLDGQIHWKYHIQQLALSEDRLKYIERFL